MGVEYVTVAKKVSKTFGEFKALDNVDLKVRKGEFFGLFGPNGAGKTTLLKILTGQIEQTGGNVKVMGIDTKADPLSVKAEIGIVPEFESPPTFLTGKEYLEFVAHLRKVPDQDTVVKDWLTFFDLVGRENTICKDMSKGMRQKLMLAGAFLHEPPLLFLDEPFINLDPIYQKKLREYLVDYVDRGNTVFMNTHILEIAEKLCTKVVIIYEGKVVASGTMDELRKKAGGDLEKVFMSAVGIEDGA